MSVYCGLPYLGTTILVLIISIPDGNAQESKNGAQLPASDFGPAQQQQPAFDPAAYQLDPNSYPTAQRLASSNAYSFTGMQQHAQQQAQQNQAAAQQQQPGGWTGEMADLSQVLAQNVVAPQVNQFQQGQPDPLAASPYHALLKNLASTAPLYPPGPPVGADSNGRVFPGQLLSPQAGLDGPEALTEKLDPPGPPHPPLNVEHANYLTAVASIPQRIGVVNFNPASLPSSFPHQTFQPNSAYTNRGQNPPPPFNPWPPQYQSGGAAAAQNQQQQQQQQAIAGLLQQQQQQQQQQFGAQQQQQQLRMAAANALNQQQRHPQSSLLQNSPPAESDNVETKTPTTPQSTKVDNIPQIKVDNMPQSTKVDNIISQQLQQVNKSETDEMLKAIVTKQVYELKIVSYGQTTCQVCEDTDKILRNYSMPVHTFRMDAMAHGLEMLRIIKKQTGSKDMPQVFICGHFVGGFRKVKDLHKTGELKNLIKRCSN